MQKTESSSRAYVLISFIVGALVMFAIVQLLANRPDPSSSSAAELQTSDAFYGTGVENITVSDDGLALKLPGGATYGPEDTVEIMARDEFAGQVEGTQNMTISVNGQDVAVCQNSQECTAIYAGQGLTRGENKVAVTVRVSGFDQARTLEQTITRQ